MGSMNDKVVVVTGAAGGIGEATARRLLAEGAYVVLADREGAPLTALAEELGPRALAVPTDVTREADVKALMEQAASAFGHPLAALVLNAGIEGQLAPLTAQEESNFDRVFAVNVKGVWLGIKHGAPRLPRGGSIVCTSSVAGFVGSPGLGPYVVSKHAVMGLVKTAAIELAPAGIRVNSVNPGPVDNRMMRSIEEMAAPGAGDTVKKGFEGMIPRGQYSSSDEIARVILFLVSDLSEAMTGTSVVADGGLLVQ
jgi:NAD(P)-dependent dehydrogenase (short-subunit alcohol dehydrogenase family)